MLFSLVKTRQLLPANQTLPGRAIPMRVSPTHAVSGERIMPPFDPQLEEAFFGVGCFWGAERLFWQLPGVVSTAVGYQGGQTPNATYEEVCSGRTNHAEVVRVIFDPNKVSYRELLQIFWEAHDPTQGMRQGNDTGSQYRSAIYTASPKQMQAALGSRVAYDAVLKAAGYPPITTEIAPAGPFYYAEDYHQQYLHKNPNGYCGLNGTGVRCAA